MLFLYDASMLPYVLYFAYKIVRQPQKSYQQNNHQLCYMY